MRLTLFLKLFEYKNNAYLSRQIFILKAIHLAALPKILIPRGSIIINIIFFLIYKIGNNLHNNNLLNIYLKLIYFKINI